MNHPKVGVGIIILNKNIKYNFNPFGGLSLEELAQVINPNKHLKELEIHLQISDPLILELVGRKGRGKTTHLQLLHRKYPESQLFSLNKGTHLFEEILKSKSSLILIDSIHHLSIGERLKIYNLQKQIVFTTHHTKWLETRLSSNKFISAKIKGISLNSLKEMIYSRVENAAIGVHEIKLNTQAIEKLITEYGDDYRGILRKLYTNFADEN